MIERTVDEWSELIAQHLADKPLEPTSGHLAPIRMKSRCGPQGLVDYAHQGVHPTKPQADPGCGKAEISAVEPESG